MCETVNIARLPYVVLHYVPSLVVADLCLLFGEAESLLLPKNRYLIQGGKLYFLVPDVFLGH